MAQADTVRLDETSLEDASGDVFFELGMTYSSGGETPVDYVTAHKWFNIATVKGHADAARLRREIAAEMSDAEIGAAQRAARDWLKQHPQTPEAAPVAGAFQAAA